MIIFLVAVFFLVLASNLDEQGQLNIQAGGTIAKIALLFGPCLKRTVGTFWKCK